MGKTLTENETRELMKGILSGISYLHTQDIIHRDLKPSNILLTEGPDLASSVRIGDFGLTFQLGGGMYHNDDACGTLLY